MTHPIGVAVGMALLVFVVVFILICFLRRDWTYVNFTPHQFIEDYEKRVFVRTGQIHPFEPRLAHYLKTSEVVITLASASLVFIPRLTVTNNQQWFAFSMTSFGLSVFFLVLLMVILLYFFEDSLYFPAQYTVKKSALVVALGVTGLTCFVLAYLSIAVEVATAVASNSVSLK